MNVVQRIASQDGKEVLMVFECPGCGIDHAFTVQSDKRSPWHWNGSMESPTFSPSLLVRWPDPDSQQTPNVCHSFVRDGMIEFLSDCTHKLAGQSVKMNPAEEEMPTDQDCDNDEPSCDFCRGTGVNDAALDDGTEDYDVCPICGGNG